MTANNIVNGSQLAKESDLYPSDSMALGDNEWRGDVERGSMDNSEKPSIYWQSHEKRQQQQLRADAAPRTYITCDGEKSMMSSDILEIPQLTEKAGKLHLNLDLEQKEFICSSRFQVKCTAKVDAGVEKYIYVIRDHNTTLEPGKTKEGGCSSVDIALADKASAQINGNEKEDSGEFIQRWEREALSHFRNSSWEGVICAGKKILQVPGQSKTNFEVLYEMGHSFMRLGEYESATKYFKDAYRIDSNRACLRLSMSVLKNKVLTGPWLKKGRGGVSREQEEVSKIICPPKQVV